MPEHGVGFGTGRSAGSRRTTGLLDVSLANSCARSFLVPPWRIRDAMERKAQCSPPRSTSARWAARNRSFGPAIGEACDRALMKHDLGASALIASLRLAHLRSRLPHPRHNEAGPIFAQPYSELMTTTKPMQLRNRRSVSVPYQP